MSENIHPRPGIYFKGIPGWKKHDYPQWRYHNWEEPIIVHNTEEDIQASKDGWKAVISNKLSTSTMRNWKYDLEDMSARQLCIFAKDEYGADLPEAAGMEVLMKAIWNLNLSAPQSQDRIILLAQTIKMNYDETLVEIRRQIKTGKAEVTTEEFEA